MADYILNISIFTLGGRFFFKIFREHKSK